MCFEDRLKKAFQIGLRDARRNMDRKKVRYNVAQAFYDGHFPEGDAEAKELLEAAHKGYDAFKRA